MEQTRLCLFQIYFSFTLILVFSHCVQVSVQTNNSLTDLTTTDDHDPNFESSITYKYHIRNNDDDANISAVTSPDVSTAEMIFQNFNANTSSIQNSTASLVSYTSPISSTTSSMSTSATQTTASTNGQETEYTNGTTELRTTPTNNNISFVETTVSTAVPAKPTPTETIATTTAIFNENSSEFVEFLKNLSQNRLSVPLLLILLAVIMLLLIINTIIVCCVCKRLPPKPKYSHDPCIELDRLSIVESKPKRRCKHSNSWHHQASAPIDYSPYGPHSENRDSSSSSHVYAQPQVYSSGSNEIRDRDIDAHNAQVIADCSSSMSTFKRSKNVPDSK